MTGIARRLVAAAVACATSLVLVMGAVPGVVRAETGTAYSATATAYYRNPATGQIEDQGGEGSGAIGSSTATSLLDGSALVEAGQSGARYVTLRLKQASELSDVRVDYDRSLDERLHLPHAPADGSRGRLGGLPGPGSRRDGRVPHCRERRVAR